MKNNNIRRNKVKIREEKNHTLSGLTPGKTKKGWKDNCRADLNRRSGSIAVTLSDMGHVSQILDSDLTQETVP